MTSTFNLSELASFLIDVEDPDCPDPALHVSAFVSDNQTLKSLLKRPLSKRGDYINSKIRPLSATPLRLASTSGNLEGVSMLLKETEVQVDAVDAKAQTPLFVALVNQRWDVAKLLLRHGADPEGSVSNRCSPLSVMAQRGYFQGVELLLEYGASTEDCTRHLMGSSGLPLAISASYSHLGCFVLLLCSGAALGQVDEGFKEYEWSQFSVPHAIIKHGCEWHYVFLYYQFGGRIRLDPGPRQSGTTSKLIRRLQDRPLSLKSQCRLVVRSHLNWSLLRGWNILGHLVDLVRFFDFGLTHEEEQLMDELGIRADVAKLESKMRQVVPSDASLAERQGQLLLRQGMRRGAECHDEGHRQDGHDAHEQRDVRDEDVEDYGPRPPTPPPMPTPPRPRMWRFPAAEFRAVARSNVATL